MKIIAIKSGGKALETQEALNNLISEIKSFKNKYNFIFFHGGGALVTETAKLFNIEAKFVNGVRMTSPEEMKVVDMVLSGYVNKSIVRSFQKNGLNAVGLSGSDGKIFTGESLDGITRTGKITKADQDLLQYLMARDFVPVISSTSMDSNCNPLNINADEAAFEVASAVKADTLIFLSDIPGVLKNNKILGKLNEKEIDSEIQSGVISGGMIPKVKSSVSALKNGVKKIIIGQYKNKGDFEKLFSNEIGTSITIK